jgi:hypothetical protein
MIILLTNAAAGASKNVLKDTEGVALGVCLDEMGVNISHDVRCAKEKKESARANIEVEERRVSRRGSKFFSFKLKRAD